MSGAERVRVEVEGVTLELSNLDKVLYPEVGFTKADLLSYYSEIAPVLLGHLAGRPVTVLRYPNGIADQGFFAKNIPRGAPAWLESLEVGTSRRGGGETTRYPLVESTAALVYLVNLAAIEFHVPMWRRPLSPEGPEPDELVFDLDPGAPAGLRECCVVALELRELLAGQQLFPLAKLSGKKVSSSTAPWRAGPPRRREGPPSPSQRRSSPVRGELAVVNMRKELRVGKVLIDWSQNAPAKTTVRALLPTCLALTERFHPPSWEEVEEVAAGDGGELRFGPAEVLRRLERLGDLFAPLLEPR